jgi:hypothetical protein
MTKDKSEEKTLVEYAQIVLRKGKFSFVIQIQDFGG